MIAPKNPQTFDGCGILRSKTTKSSQNRDLDLHFWIVQQEKGYQKNYEDNNKNDDLFDVRKYLGTKQLS